MQLWRIAMFLGCLWGSTDFAASAAEVARLERGQLVLEVALPDAERGLYRGSRFDAGSMIRRATFGGVEFFGRWKVGTDAADPEAGYGPAEEFDIDGPRTFAGTPRGGEFLKLGVGVLRRETDQP